MGDRPFTMNGVFEPVLETCRAEARVWAWGEALVVHLEAVVERVGIGGYLPRVPGCVQELTHEFVLANWFGTGQLEHAVQGLGEGDIGHGSADVVRCDGLHQSRRNPNRL